ncbi:MAG: orotate phosphoribosyltransferase [Paludibacteraceae bacterium]|nr:orotate phosphoribosyltransferase [Paludibacteraceae bacterium]
MESIENSIARKLLQIKAFSVQIDHPFAWGNGWQAPIYLDDRKILSIPSVRNFFRLEMSRLVAERFADADVIAGIAINAIAHGILVAEQLALPFVSVYPYPKDHGLENQIEGDLRPRQNVVIIENQVNVGDHLLRVIESLRNNGCNVLGAITLFDYEFPIAKKRLNTADVQLFALTNFSAVCQEMQKTQLCTPEVMDALNLWHKHPNKWNK